MVQCFTRWWYIRPTWCSCRSLGHRHRLTYLVEQLWSRKFGVSPLLSSVGASSGQGGHAPSVNSTHSLEYVGQHSLAYVMQTGLEQWLGTHASNSRRADLRSSGAASAVARRRRMLSRPRPSIRSSFRSAVARRSIMLSGPRPSIRSSFVGTRFPVTFKHTFSFAGRANAMLPGDRRLMGTARGGGRKWAPIPSDGSQLQRAAQSAAVGTAQ